jgi:hypothetical protein
VSTILNFAVFEVEANKNYHQGIKMSEKLISDCQEKMDGLPEEEYK